MGQARMGDVQVVSQKLERLNRLYAMLSQINRCIVRSDDPNELFAKACRIAVDEGGFYAAWVGLVEPSGERLHPVARFGAAIDFDRLALTLADAPDNCSAAVSAIREGRPCLVDLAEGGGELPAGRAAVLTDAGVGALALLPLVIEGSVSGVFGVAAVQPGGFQAAEVRLLTEVADDLSFAMQVMHCDQKRAVAETKVQYLAFYDSQTGLPGRCLFSERLAAVGASPVAVLAINLRRYHGVLQTLGQAVGPKLARAVATRLETRLPTAVVGRISESEFACQIDCGAGLHAVEETAWQLHRGLAEALPVDGREVYLEPFIGIAVQPQDGVGAEVIDAALLAAGAGAGDSGGACRFFVAGMDGSSRLDLDTDAALRRAIERREFVLHFQPQVDLASGRIVGAEALLRWQRPGHGLVPPGHFIPLLEATDLIVQVGRWVIAEACACARRWQDEGLPPFRMAVNLSARQFQEGDIGDTVRRALAESGLAPCWLELEVTESAVLLDADAVIRTLVELRTQGVSHALDDFGTGYSSLSYLQRLPISRIKIDQSFVANVNSNPQSAAIVRAVVGMAHSLRLSVVAEGVETEGQLAFLRGLGCEEMQGFLFSRALPGEAFAALLRENRRLAPAPGSAPAERTLLVVDDEPNVLSSLRRTLRQTDMRVLTAGSAQEGFDLLSTYPVGVVVCDQRMVEMTGTEFLRRVRELHPDAVRIVLSGYTDLNSVIDAVNRGAIFKFITKPWDEGLLIEALRDAFRLHDIERKNRELSLRLDQVLATARSAA